MRRAVSAGLALACLALFVATPVELRTQLAIASAAFLASMLLARRPGRLATLALVFISLAATGRYLYWRLTATIGGEWSADAVLGGVLLAAELYACAMLVLAYGQSVAGLPRKPAPLPDDLSRWPTVDVFIPTYNEPLEIVRATVLAARALDWPAEKLRIFILDDGRREAFRAFAAEANVGYVTRSNNAHAKAGNLNHALRITDGEWIAIFDCDHVPTRSFLQVTAGWLLRDPRLALVQTPHHFYSPDPYSRNLGTAPGVPAESELFYGVIQPGLDTWNASFFCGSCAVLRREALLDVGGIAVQTVTEDAHTALRMHRRGWRTAYLAIPQAAGLETETLAGHVGQRIRWARGMAQIFRVDNPLLGRGLTLSQRLCYLAAMLHFFSGIPRLVFLIAPVAYLVFGRHVFNALPLAAVAYGLPHLLHSTQCNARIHGRFRHSFWSEVYETCLAVYTAIPTTVALFAPRAGTFNVTAKGRRVDVPYFDAKVARPSIVLGLVNLAAIVAGFYKLWRGEGDLDSLAINVAWAVHNLVIVSAAIAVACERPQVREGHRVPVRLPAMLRFADGRTVRCETRDLGRGGAGVVPAGRVRAGPGEHLWLSLFSFGEEQALPATVVDQGDQLRVRFLEMSLEQESHLVRTIFSRADAWLGWADGHRRDHPLRTLGAIAARGATGLARAVRLSVRPPRLPAPPRVPVKRLACILLPLFAFGARAAPRVAELGPSRAQRDSGSASLELPFTARADEELTAARVRLAFEPDAQLEGLEVLVNDERVASLAPADMAGGVRELPVARGLLADRNMLTLRLRDRAGRCTARSGAWRSLRSVAVLLEANPVALPNQLALLPLPFYDRGFDTRATVPVVLGAAPEGPALRLAGMAASWFAVGAPIPIAFEAHLGALPEGSAIVLVGSAAEADALGLPPPGPPAIRMVDHPRHPDSNVKLIVIEGRTFEELTAAVESLAAREEPLSGQAVALRPAKARPPALPWSAPRWIPSGRAVRFAESPEKGVPSHDGSTAATLSARFRVAPDLWLWPGEFVLVDLAWTERLPRDVAPPRLDVEFNGFYVATLPSAPGSGKVRLRIPREHMRGFNELLVHVHYPEPDPCAAAAAPPPGDPPRISIDGDSELHLEGSGHFAPLPDVSLFVFDGYPFSRVPDLGETAIVLPERPGEPEVSAVLSILGRIAQVTGRVPDRATFATAGAEERLRDKDLLVVGDRALPARWSGLLPLAVENGGARVHRPNGPAALLELTSGIAPLLDERAAGDVLERNRDFAAIESIESPLGKGRAAVFVLASGPLPPFEAFTGYAQSRARAGDLLLVAGGERYMFRVGASFGRGELGGWTRLRWFLANHWMLLIPFLIAGALLLAAESRAFVERRMRERLRAGAMS